MPPDGPRIPPGNTDFAVQYVLDNAPMDVRDELYKQLAGRIPGSELRALRQTPDMIGGSSPVTPTLRPVSEHKYASNVVERALERCSYGVKCLIVDEMMGGDDMADGYDGLRSLIIDEFAVSCLPPSSRRHSAP